MPPQNIEKTPKIKLLFHRVSERGQEELQNHLGNQKEKALTHENSLRYSEDSPSVAVHTYSHGAQEVQGRLRLKKSNPVN